jgi:hypothetical protein
MDITKINKLQFGPHTWLYLAGTDECGSEIHHEAYCVEAEDEKGYRWVHDYTFKFSNFIRKAEGDPTKAREELEHKVNKLITKIKLHLRNGGNLMQIIGLLQILLMVQMLIATCMGFNKLS